MTGVLLSAQPQQIALRKDAGLVGQTAAKRAKNQTPSASAGAKDESGAALLGGGGELPIHLSLMSHLNTEKNKSLKNTILIILRAFCAQLFAPIIMNLEKECAGGRKKAQPAF